MVNTRCRGCSWKYMGNMCSMHDDYCNNIEECEEYRDSESYEEEEE